MLLCCSLEYKSESMMIAMDKQATRLRDLFIFFFFPFFFCLSVSIILTVLIESCAGLSTLHWSLPIKHSFRIFCNDNSAPAVDQWWYLTATQSNGKCKYWIIPFGHIYTTSVYMSLSISVDSIRDCEGGKLELREISIRSLTSSAGRSMKSEDNSEFPCIVVV